MLQFENPNELREDQINVIERYVTLMYARGSGLESVNVCQRYLFTYKNLSSESLPPTYDAHKKPIQHLKRAFCQGRLVLTTMCLMFVVFCSKKTFSLSI